MLWSATPSLLQVESIDSATNVSCVHLYFPHGSDGLSSVADELVMRGQARRVAPPTNTGEGGGGVDLFFTCPPVPSL